MTTSFGSYNPIQTSKNNRYTTFYLKDGDNIYRVLPPVKSLADKNKIAQYYSVIWLTAPNGKKYAVNSIAVKNKDNKVIQPDPLLDKIEELNLQLKSALASGRHAEVQSIKEMQKKIFQKKFYALNVMSPSGEVGVLHLPYTAYQNLQVKLKELYQNGIDAISIGPTNGIFFNFKKQRDERGKVTYPVEVAMKMIKTEGGEIMATYHKAPISESEAPLIAEKAQDLTTLFRTLSFSEMSLLASLSQEAFDAVFSNGVAASEMDMDQEDNGDDDVDLEKFTTSMHSKTTNMNSNAVLADYKAKIFGNN